MKLDYLHLVGIGTHRDEIELPIAELGDAQVVVFTGDNGAGKSTAAEVAAPGIIYDKMPSRKRSLVSMANRRDSGVLARWDVGGKQIELEAKINGIARKAKAEWFIRVDGKPIETKGLSKHYKTEIAHHFPSARVYLASAFAAQGGDGFIGMERADRRQLFGELLGLSRLDELADAFGDWAKTSKSLLDTAKTRATDLRDRAGDAGVIRQTLNERRVSLVALTADIAKAEKQIETDRAALDEWGIEAQRRATAVDVAAAEVSSAKQQRDAHQATLDSAQRQAIRAQTQVTRLEGSLAERPALERVISETNDADRKLKDAEVDLARHRDELETWRLREAELKAALKPARTTFDSCLAEIERVGKEGGTIKERLLRAEKAVQGYRAAVDKRPELEGLIADSDGAELSLSEAESRLEQIREASKIYTGELFAWKDQVSETKRRSESCALAHKQAVGLAAKLDGIECAGAPDFSGCPFLDDARGAASELQPLRVTAANAAATYKDMLDCEPAPVGGDEPQREVVRLARCRVSERETAQAKLGAMESAQRALDEAAAEIERLSAEREEKVELWEAAKIAREEARYQLTKAEGAELTHRGSGPAGHELDAEIAALRGDVDRRTEAQAKLDAMASLQEQLDAGREDLARLDAEILDANNEAGAANETYLGTTCNLSSATHDRDHHLGTEPKDRTTDLEVLRNEEGVSRTSVGRLEAELEQATKAGEDLASVDAEIATLTQDLDDWVYLQRAYGQQIKALEIDAAGPEVGAIANDLLHRCFGARFSVSLITSELKADGKSEKEVFSLSVIDTEKGWEGDAAQLSGGEKVIVGEAFSLSIAIMNARRSDIPMADLFRDECSGALSAANAARYVEMLRAAVDIGGFSRVYFISHQEELWALADQRIHFDETGCHLR